MFYFSPSSHRIDCVYTYPQLLLQFHMYTYIDIYHTGQDIWFVLVCGKLKLKNSTNEAR